MRVQINGNRDVVMPPACGGLIKSHLANGAMVRPSSGLLYMVTDDSPNTGIVFADQLRDILDRHVGCHCQDEPLKHQGESTAGPSPRNEDLMNAVL